MGLFNRGKVWFSANRNSYLTEEDSGEGFAMYKDVSGVPTQIGELGNYHEAITDATTATITAATSGKIHVIPDLTADITITLPAPKDGLKYEFVSKAVASDAQDWIFISPGTADMYGGVQWADTTGDTVGEVYGAATDDTMTVLTPLAGTRVVFLCDGTDWIVNGTVVSLTIPTIA